MSDLITIATFATSSEAGPAQSALEANGIRTYVQGGASADLLSYYGTAIGGVKLQVAADDVERALACLGLGDSGGEHPSPEPWDCRLCGAQVDSGFEICWSCGASMDGTRADDAIADIAKSESPGELTARCPMCGQAVGEDTPQCPACGESLNTAPLAPQTDIRAEQQPQWPSPAELESVDEPEVLEELPQHVRILNEILTRAFRAAVIGIVFCPPLLSFYSMSQLTEYHRLRNEYELGSNWRATMAGVLNWLVILFVAILLLVFSTDGYLPFITDWADWLDPP